MKRIAFGALTCVKGSEWLISWLDSTIDVDEDSSADDGPCDGDDFEPSLGSFDRMSNQIKAWQSNGYADVGSINTSLK
jgi:hypothetical protein